MRKYTLITLFAIAMLFFLNGYSQNNITVKIKDMSFEMIFVEGGTFEMGCTSEQTACKQDEKPAHKITLSDYYLSEIPVTQKLWKEVMKTNVRQQWLAREIADRLTAPKEGNMVVFDSPDFSAEDYAKVIPLPGEGDDYPVYFVNYYECKEFCERLNQTFAHQLPVGYRFTLPSEAQWEYAARGGKKSKGYIYSGSNNVDDVAWYNQPVDGFLLNESDGTASPVSKKLPNELGIYDMSGNVWEWCSDWYDENYYSTSPSNNPMGSDNGIYRSLRGGCWNSIAQSCHVSNRLYYPPEGRTAKYGFRICLMQVFDTDSFMSQINLLTTNSSSNKKSKSDSSTPKSSFKENLTFYVNEDKIEMLFVEGGTFVMGCTSMRKECASDQIPAHYVTLSEFYLGKFQVTQKLWEAVMGTNLRQQCKLSNNSFEPHGEGDRFPMYYINYGDCEKFCTRLNQLLSNQLPEGYKFSLPTEAQWEYAARGGKKSKNYKYSGNNNVSKVAWYDDNSDKKTHEVGKKKPNSLGFYDMSGNVWEWCSDWYDENYYNEDLETDTFETDTIKTDPLGPDSGTHRVLRGGSWYFDAQKSLVFFRAHYTPEVRSNNIGVRVVLVKE